MAQLKQRQRLSDCCCRQVNVVAQFALRAQLCWPSARVAAWPTEHVARDGCLFASTVAGGRLSECLARGEFAANRCAARAEQRCSSLSSCTSNPCEPEFDLAELELGAPVPFGASLYLLVIINQGGQLCSHSIIFKWLGKRQP